MNTITINNTPTTVKAGMPAILIGGKEYKFKKPVLAIARKAAKFETYRDVQKLVAALTSDEEFTKFAAAWREFYEAAFENPASELELENLTVPEVSDIISNFTLAMSGIAQSLPVGRDTLPDSNTVHPPQAGRPDDRN